MSLQIISVGKKHEAWVSDGIERYEKRLKRPWNVEWVLLPHSSFEGDRARQEESERILSRLESHDYVILLDETGKNINSPTLSQYIEAQFVAARPVVLVIGGAYGVSPELQQRAHFTWSLSKLVLPHQLVRLVLIEQLYRAQEIAHGGKYHHV